MVRHHVDADVAVSLDRAESKERGLRLRSFLLIGLILVVLVLVVVVLIVVILLLLVLGIRRSVFNSTVLPDRRFALAVFRNQDKRWFATLALRRSGNGDFRHLVRHSCRSPGVVFALLGVALALFGGVFGLFRLVGWKFYSNGVVGFPQHAVDASDDVVDESVVF